MPLARGASSCQFAGLAAGLLSAVQGGVRLTQPSERSFGGAASWLRLSLLRGTLCRVALATVLVFHGGVAVYAWRTLCLRPARSARAVVPNGPVGLFSSTTVGDRSDERCDARACASSGPAVVLA